MVVGAGPPLQFLSCTPSIPTWTMTPTFGDVSTRRMVTVDEPSLGRVLQLHTCPGI
jgi:hypothetical protein